MEAASLPLWKQKHAAEASVAGDEEQFWGATNGGFGTLTQELANF